MFAIAADAAVGWHSCDQVNRSQKGAMSDPWNSYDSGVRIVAAVD
jgi:hypothetical protein